MGCQLAAECGIAKLARISRGSGSIELPNGRQRWYHSNTGTSRPWRNITSVPWLGILDVFGGGSTFDMEADVEVASRMWNSAMRV